MSATRWAVGLAIAAGTVIQLTLLATDVGSRNGPPDGRGQPGRAPASIQLTPDPIAIQCDSADASTVSVRITDGQGRSVPDGTIVHFDARFGFADPVEAETSRGEASTQLRLYPAARNFPGDTGVDVFTDGLRASVGIDCAPADPPCNPFSPPTHPASPPCSAGPCSTTDSPPIGTSVPCPTPTQTPQLPCFPQSPPCETPTPTPICGPTFSPPCITPTQTPAPQRCDASLTPTPVPGDPSYRMYLDAQESGGVIFLTAGVESLGGTEALGVQWEVCRNGAALSFLRAEIAPTGHRDCTLQSDDGARRTLLACFDPGGSLIAPTGDMWVVTYSCQEIGPVDFTLGPLTLVVLDDGQLTEASIEVLNAAAECTSTPPTLTPTPTPFCDSLSSPPCAGRATLALDVDITNGSGPCTQIDDAASMSVGESLQVAVCLVNPDGTVPMAGFEYRVAYDDRVVVAPEVPDVGLGLDDNPDANAGATTFTTPLFPAALGGGWDCSAGVGAYPKGDTDAVAQDGDGTAYSGGCGSAPGPNTLIQGPLGVITFTALSAGGTSLAFFHAAVVNDELVELGSCDPVIDFAMLCLGATIVVDDGTPTSTPTPGGRGHIDLSTPTSEAAIAPSRQRL